MPQTSAIAAKVVVDTEQLPAGVIAGARIGDSVSLTAIYHAHANAMFTLARRLTGSTYDAEDIVHDVFVRLPALLRHYEERGSLLPWLKRVIVTHALSQRRRVDRRDARTPIRDTTAPSRAASDVLLDRITVDDALALLPDTLRRIVVLRVYEGFSHAEIAALLGIRTGTSEVRFSRALARLRTLLGGSR